MSIDLTKPVQCWNGWEAEVWKKDGKVIFGRFRDGGLEWVLTTWTEDGRYYSDVDNVRDLINIPEPKQQLTLELTPEQHAVVSRAIERLGLDGVVGFLDESAMQSESEWRYFVHPTKFTCGTAYVKCKRDSRCEAGVVVDRNGHEVNHEYWTLSFAEKCVRRGDWKEITEAEALALVKPQEAGK